MVRVVQSLALAVYMAIFATEKSPTVIPVRKGTSGKPLTSHDVVKRDLARIAVYNGKPESIYMDASGSGAAINQDVTYVAQVSFCSQTFKLVVDTGSSNIWAGAGDAVSSSCGTSTGNRFLVPYGSGIVSGTEKTGPVSYGGLAVPKQSFGAASSASGFPGVDGIIGFGPVGLTHNTVTNTDLVPTFMNNLYSQRSISTETLGVYFAPESGSDTDDANGELTIGGVDSAKYTGFLNYFTKSTVPRYSGFWGIDVASLTYGSTTLQSYVSAIVDTGTTLIYIPSPAYREFLSAARGTFDTSTNMTRFSTLPTGTFTINIDTVSYPLTPSQYLVPTAQYSHFGLSSGFFYSWILDAGANPPGGINFVLGQKFLENYYSIYDTTHSRIGFATRT